VTSFLAVPHVLAECDAWSALPAPFAKKLEREGGFVSRPLPKGLERSPFALHLIWPEAQDASAASRWLRGLVLDAARAV
jgi:DNA-binding transcriptional LysR family regulator